MGPGNALRQGISDWFPLQMACITSALRKVSSTRPSVTWPLGAAAGPWWPVCMRIIYLGSARWAIAGPVSRATGLTTQRGMATGPITTRLGLQRRPPVMTTRWVALSFHVERVGSGVWLEQSMWKGGWEMGMWRWGWRRTEVHVLSHSFFPPRLFGWWGLIVCWRRVGFWALLGTSSLEPWALSSTEGCVCGSLAGGTSWVSKPECLSLCRTLATMTFRPRTWASGTCPTSLPCSTGGTAPCWGTIPTLASSGGWDIICLDSTRYMGLLAGGRGTSFGEQSQCFGWGISLLCSLH